MEIDNIYIQNCSAYIPTNLIDPNDVENLINSEAPGYESIAVENELFPLEMACTAINQIIASIKSYEEDFIFSAYTSVHNHGHNIFWSPASFIQKQFSLFNAIPINLSQGCNAQMLAIHTAILHLLHSKNGNSKALITSADNFSISEFSRWNSDYGIIYGDASSAVVLGKGTGIAKIINFYNVSDPFLEEMHREIKATVMSTLDIKNHYNVRKTKKRFLEQYGSDFLMNRTKVALKKLHKAIFSGWVTPKNIKHYILPNLGISLLEKNYYPIFPEAVFRSTYSYGNKLGHLGTSDCMASLSYLFDCGDLKNGDLVFILGAGSGFTWSAMIIQVI